MILPWRASCCAQAKALVEPGGHRGSSKAYRRHSVGMTDDSPYKNAFDQVIASIYETNSVNGSDPDEFGQKLADVLKKKHLPRRLIIGNTKQRLSVIMHSILPSDVFDRFVLNTYTKD